VLAVTCGELTIQPEINAGHILSAAATLSVGLILNQIYNRHASTRSVERQLLLTHASEISNALADAYSAFLACPIGKKIPKELSDRVSTAERRLSNAVHSMETALNSCGVRTPKGFDLLKEARFSLKEALTDDPFPLGAYTGADAGRINGAFTKMRDEATRSTFALNKALN
jgi:hypothetical protein